MSNKYEDWLMNGGDYPGLDIDEVALPESYADYIESVEVDRGQDVD